MPQGVPTLLEQILPPAAVAAETRGELLEQPLFAAEESLVSAAVEKRRREFQSGRACARVALAELGVAPRPILRGSSGEPLWPGGVVGSITHCRGYRGSAVARGSELAALGIDAEPDLPLPPGVLDEISLPSERLQLDRLSSEESGVSWDRLLFCAKEAVLKAWFPLAGKPLDFAGAVVTIDRRRRAFRARLAPMRSHLGPAAPLRFRGRWLAAEGLLLAATAVPSSSRAGPASPLPRS